MIILSTDFVTPWNNLFSAVTGAVPGLLALLAMVGVALIVWDWVKFIKDKKNGGGGNMKALIGGNIFGAILVIPTVIIPIILKFAGWGLDLILGFAGIAH